MVLTASGSGPDLDMNSYPHSCPRQPNSEKSLPDSRSSLLSLHFGFKNYLLITSVISAVLTVGFPMLIRQNYTFGIVSRIFLGSLHSGWFPGTIIHSNQGSTNRCVRTTLCLNHLKRYKVHGEHGHPKKKNAN